MNTLNDVKIKVVNHQEYFRMAFKKLFKNYDFPTKDYPNLKKEIKRLAQLQQNDLLHIESFINEVISEAIND